MHNQTTYGDISPRTAAYASKTLIKRAQELSHLERFGQFDPQGKNKSKTRKWRQYNSLPPAVAPLAEGIPPAGSKITCRDVTCVLEQYGDLVPLTDVVVDTHEDPVLDEAVKLCGEQYSDTVELLRYYVVRAGTNVIYAGGVDTRGEVNAPISKTELKLAYRSFKRAKAKPFTEIIAATYKISTTPIPPSFFALGHTDLKADIEEIPGFIPVEKYADHTKALPGEIGAAEGFRFVLSSLFTPWEQAGASGTTYLSATLAPTSDSAADVYPLLLIARDAYGIVPMQGANAVKPAVMNPSTISHSNPMGQSGFVSWKTWQGCAILTHGFLIRIECAATANPR